MTDSELTALNTLRDTIRRRRKAIGSNLEAEYYLNKEEYANYKALLVKEIKQYTDRQAGIPDPLNGTPF